MNTFGDPTMREAYAAGLVDGAPSNDDIARMQRAEAEVARLRGEIRTYLISQYGPNFDSQCRVYEVDAGAARLADLLTPEGD